MARTVFAAMVVVALVALPAQAWWCTGHMTIAQIAKNIMHPDAVTAAENVIGQLSKMGPFPMIPQFVDAACWADDLKRDTAEMKNWHFLNMPYDPTNYPITVNAQHNNVAYMVGAFDASARLLEKDKNIWQLAFSLGNLIHFYGDISQPLHVTEMFSAQFPNGDKGGNLFHIVANGTTQVLHAYWDAICNQYTTDPTRPLTAEGQQLVENLATQFMNTYNYSTAQKTVTNSSLMAQESYNFAVKYAYNGISPGGSITTPYYNACADIAGYQITLAGYRLGNDMNNLFKDQTPTSETINDRLRELHEEYARHATMKRVEHNNKMEALKRRR